MRLGSPRLHLRLTDSTNQQARALAMQGAPHGALVTASEQSAGRGRQGRTWIAPAGRALLASLVIRRPPPLLPLRAGVAVAETCGAASLLKWPNDVLVSGLKVAGILVEARAQEEWAVVGIGINVAVSDDDLPGELHGRAGGLGGSPADVESTLSALLGWLGHWLDAGADQVLAAWRERDALLGQRIRWASGAGEACGVDEDGRLVVQTLTGAVKLDAGEVHLMVQPS